MVQHSIPTPRSSQETTGTSKEMSSIKVNSICQILFWGEKKTQTKPSNLSTCFSQLNISHLWILHHLQMTRNLCLLMTSSTTESATKNILVLSSSSLVWKNGSIYTNKKIVFRNKQTSKESAAYIS